VSHVTFYEECSLVGDVSHVTSYEECSGTLTDVQWETAPTNGTHSLNTSD